MHHDLLLAITPNVGGEQYIYKECSMMKSFVNQRPGLTTQSATHLMFHYFVWKILSHMTWTTG